jgi:Uma2 family endonuclease
MSPQRARPHTSLLMLPEGRTITDCPVSTSDGVKAPDVAWVMAERRQEVRSLICLTRAPEICVEVLSPSNTAQEIQEKTALYFEAGASEVWICEEDGHIRFHFQTQPNIRQNSELCPGFPQTIEVA